MNISKFPKKIRKQVIEVISIENIEYLKKEKKRLEIKSKRFNLASEHLKDNDKFSDSIEILKSMELTREEKEMAEYLNVEL